MSDLLKYLDLLSGNAPADHFVELRHRVSETGLAATFYPVGDRASIADAIRSRAHTDVYAGCVPRTRRAGTTDAVGVAWVVWAECDGEAATRAALGWDPPPTLVVASGTPGNVHAYWALREPLGPQAVEGANLRLAYGLGADVACFDVGRILRPPETLNFKRTPPSAVRTVLCEPDRRYLGEIVVRRAPKTLDLSVQRRWHRPRGRDSRHDPLLMIPPTVYVADLLGVRIGRDHKVPCPFHEDRRPSLHVYPAAARGWSCFSCRRGGSIYDLASGLWDLDTRGADFMRLRERLHQRFAYELNRGLAR